MYIYREIDINRYIGDCISNKLDRQGIACMSCKGSKSSSSSKRNKVSGFPRLPKRDFIVAVINHAVCVTVWKPILVWGETESKNLKL